MYLVSILDESTSAIIPTPPAISTALPWAPLIPPRPEVTNNFPFKFPSLGIPNFNLPAFNIVEYVPWTIPCGPIYIQPPAVIWP